MKKSNYDKFPSTSIKGEIIKGWQDILDAMKEMLIQDKTLIIDLYPGVIEEELIENLQKLGVDNFYNVRQDLFKPENIVKEMTQRYMTDDVLFGYIAPLTMQDFFDLDKVQTTKQEIQSSTGTNLVVGIGASLLATETATVLYIDMARWEIIQRFRREEAPALGIDDRKEPTSIQHKRAYFIDWRLADRYKDKLYQRVNYWLDTHIKDEPKMISKDVFMEGIEKTINRPFRVVPFFDPAPWGGQWMREVFDLDQSKPNYGWCFDCVPEENSLLLNIDGTPFEMPSINLVQLHTRKLLGEPVEARFGKDFPIRFDFLDTVAGGSLSLQVHPTTQYIREKFGMFYTQDESYYMVDAMEGAYVYLGLKTGINKDDMIDDLRKAQRGEIVFDAEKYSNKIPARKHDHFLIPGGTVHCSGPQGVVLEISSTPNLFTFKLWDWGRLGLDGKPRPINVEHGKNVIDWGRDTEYTFKHLVNVVEKVDEGDGWVEEKTGLHNNEFIETRRHWFTKTVTHKTDNSVNVFNLLEGEEAIIESPKNKFDPFVVHYGETFIIPAWIEEYTIRPYGEAEGKQCVTIKAYVRIV